MPPGRLVAHEDPAVGAAQPLGRRLQLGRGHGQQLRAQLLGGQARGVAGDERGPAGVRTDVPRLDRGVGVDDVDALQRHAERLGDDHGEHGLRALADLGGAGDQRDACRSRRASRWRRSRRSGRCGRRRRRGTCRRSRRRASSPAAGGGGSRGGVRASASRHSGIAQDVITKPCGLASPGRVTLRRRISSRSRPRRSARSSICALDRERRLEVAVAAHRARVGVVRVGDRRVEAHVRARDRDRPPSTSIT